MHDRLSLILRQHNTEKGFFELIARTHPRENSEYACIKRGYRSSEKAHFNRFRESGDQVFSHVRAVTIFVILLLDVTDPNTIVASLHHDTVEDSEKWSTVRLAEEFSTRVAILVHLVSRKDLSLFGSDRDLRDMLYWLMLTHTAKEFLDAVRIKLADCLHNLLEMWPCSLEKKTRKVKEMKQYALPLAEKYGILVDELRTVIRALENELELV